MPIGGFSLVMACGLLAMGLEKAGAVKEFPEGLLKAAFAGVLGLMLVFAILSLVSVGYSLFRRRWKRAAATLALFLAIPMGWMILCVVGPSPEEVYGPDYGKTPVGEGRKEPEGARGEDRGREANGIPPDIYPYNADLRTESEPTEDSVEDRP
jgi:hypothetical protein